MNQIIRLCETVPENSIEITLVIFDNDLWPSQDGVSALMLVLLDLSVAFNTIDSILLNQLQELEVGSTILVLLLSLWSVSINISGR